MNIRNLLTAIPWLVALSGAIAVASLLQGTAPVELHFRLPVETIEQAAETQQVVDLHGTLETFGGQPSSLPGAWPGFRGPSRDGISTGTIDLALNWPESGPPKLWELELGEGYAGAAVLNGRVYVHDYDHEAEAEIIRCVSLDDGREIWRYSYNVHIRRNHGMSRTIPAVTDKYLVAMGALCHVTCLDSQTGERRWAIDLQTEYGTRVPPWYTGQCPLIDGGFAILAPGGDDVLMMAVDCETGEIVWERPNDTNWQMSHSSIVKMDLNGRETYVYAASGGVVGVDASDGALLWGTSEWRISMATVPTPVIVDNERIFLSGGYNAGSLMIRIVESDGKYSVEELFRLPARVFGAEQQTPILHGGHIYGVSSPGGELVCLDLDGNRLWSSGRADRFGLGPFVMAGGKMLLLDDSGVLTLAGVSPQGFNRLARAGVLNGNEAWGPMAVASGRLIVRNLTTMVCLDITGE